MIILDLNQVMISNLMAQIGNHTNTPIEEDLIRHMVLNSIRSLKTKFSEYGELIIACDDKRYWRREIFQPYKAHRKKAREESDLDWNAVFNCLNKIRDELKEYFPYRVIQVSGAEADDVIGTLAHGYGSVLASGEKILILSGDKDFQQLQKFGNVQQFDPVRKKFIKAGDPERFLQEHIMNGDRGDGVPNFLSPDNSIIDGIRQKPLTSKKLDSWIGKQPEEFCTEEMLRNYKRNQLLIDLTYIPIEIKNTILDHYNQQAGKSRDKLFNYFVHHKLKNLMENISEF